MNKQVFILALIPLLAFSENNDHYVHKTPQQIQAELDADEAMFKKAKEMFNPWYTGPLLTPSASMMPPGYGNIQPYLFVTDNFASFNSERKSISLPHSKINVNPTLGLQFGVTNTMDIALGMGAQGNWQNSHQGGGYSDMTVTLGWPICAQTLSIPQMKFTLQETFPSGRYQHLSSDGLALSATGSGSWQTQFGFAISKLFFWSTKHPFNTRLFMGYKVALPVKVCSFNAYGGGYGTRGTVHPGNTFSTDLGLELSITQRWVVATDLVYTAQSSSSFRGKPGRTSAGPASVGGGYSDSLVIAPAVEYNWNPNLGFLAGMQVAVYGRNSSQFVSGIMSITWTFGPM